LTFAPPPVVGGSEGYYETEDYILVFRKSRGTYLQIPYPEGAEVILRRGRDTLLVGTVPFRMRTLVGGPHTVEISYRGYVWRGDVNLHPGHLNILYIKSMWRDEWREEHEDYVVVVRPADGTFLRVAQPAGCRVRWKNLDTYETFVGRIPTVKEVNPGRFSVKVECRRRVWRGEIEVRPNTETILYVRMRGGGRHMRPMDDVAFARLLKAVKEAPFSSEKLTLIEDAASKNYFKSEQVLQLLKTFNFDSYRLKAAKVLYPRVVDPENFFIVYDAFTFSSSKEELRRWIEEYDGRR